MTPSLSSGQRFEDIHRVSRAASLPAPIATRTPSPGCAPLTSRYDPGGFDRVDRSEAAVAPRISIDRLLRADAVVPPQREHGQFGNQAPARFLLAGDGFDRRVNRRAQTLRVAVLNAWLGVYLIWRVSAGRAVRH